MKRLLCAALVLAMVFGIAGVFAGCKNSDGDKLVCGITNYEPMNYLDTEGNWTGFDTEFALLVGEKLGIEVKFQEIKWEQKYTELAAGTIDCIWNGFTANTTEDDGKQRSEYVDFSYSYMLNQQCVVIKADNADTLSDEAALAGKTAAAEKGSAGETVAKDLVGDSGAMIDSPAQTNTLTEVKSGAVDIAVIDILLAQSMVGKGNYSDLAIAEITLPSEVYAIGFKKGSDLKDKVNNAIKELYDEGKLTELAEKYDLVNSLQIDTNFK